MQSENYKIKITKLRDVKSRVEAMINIFETKNFPTNKHQLEKMLFETDFVLEQLSEFKTFHAYSIIKKLSSVLRQIENKEISMKDRLSLVILHLLKISEQQIVLIQNVIENKVVADETLDALESELQKNKKFFYFDKKELKLPALTFSTGSRPIVTMNLKKREIARKTPVDNGITIDDKKFDLLQESYSKIIKAKNVLTNMKDDSIKSLCNDINNFAEIYEELNLVPINVYFDDIIKKADQYLSSSNRNITVNSFWGRAKFPYSKISTLEKYLGLFLEIHSDYQIGECDKNSYLEVKSDIVNNDLKIEVNSNFFPQDIFSIAEQNEDGRLESLNLYEKSLLIKKVKASYKGEKCSYTIMVPLRTNVQASYLLENNKEKLFVLEEDLVEFVVLDNSTTKLELDFLHYIDGDKSIPIRQDSSSKLLGKIGVVLGRNGDHFIIPVDEIIKKEYISYNASPDSYDRSVKGLVTYGNEEVPLIDGHYNIKNLVVIKNQAVS